MTHAERRRFSFSSASVEKAVSEASAPPAGAAPPFSGASFRFSRNPVGHARVPLGIPDVDRQIDRLLDRRFPRPLHRGREVRALRIGRLLQHLHDRRRLRRDRLVPGKERHPREVFEDRLHDPLLFGRLRHGDRGGG